MDPNVCIDLDGICMPADQIEDDKNDQTAEDAMESGQGGIWCNAGGDTITKEPKEDSVTLDSDGTRSNGSGVDNIKAEVFMISGCEDSQTSADVSNVSAFSLPDPNGRAGGACTSALLEVLYSNGTAADLTFIQVLQRMRSILSKGGYSQIPQLTSSDPLDVNDTFYIVPDKCTGTKRAVLIGINYVGQKGELSGCHNDCLNMKDYIKDVWGFKEENIIVLMDDGYHTSPTRSNIMRAYQTVTTASRSSDAVFCHYSGHGGRVRDDDWGEEADGYDETLVPVDYHESGQIRDDDLMQNLVCAMPAGSTLVSLMDCCHSGTVLDLPHQYRVDSGSSSLFGSSNNGAGKPPSKKFQFLVLLLILAVLAVAIAMPRFYNEE